MLQRNRNVVCAAWVRAALFMAGTFGVLHAAPAPVFADTAVDSLRQAKGKKAIVLFFVATDCPISNAYAPEIRRIEVQYAPRGMSFYSVYADPAQTLANALKHAGEYGLPGQVRLDPAHRLARKVGATVTPEAAVLSPDGRLLYRGRIDDLYVGFGKRRETATRPLIKINDWDFNWQATYHVKERVHLPKGTIVHAEWTHDNTASNIHNPNQPPKRIQYGENSTDEMAGVLINVYVNSPADNGVLWLTNLGHLAGQSLRPAAHSETAGAESKPSTK